MAVSFDQFVDELKRLCERFERGSTGFLAPDYSEARLRSDFLDPFFRALGWDLENREGLVQSRREVEIESRTDMAGHRKRADYLFRTDGVDRFICEAKKPAEELRRHAFQTKRYAWNKGVLVGVLSDFEGLHVFIVGQKPHPDEPDVGRWREWDFRQYPTAAREIWDLLSREAIAGGSIDKLIDSLPKRKSTGKGKARQQWLIKPDRTRALDAEFLNFLDEARQGLGTDLLQHNDRADLLADNRLNEAVQRILDRLLFLRICEDRDIDTGRPLAHILRNWREHAANPPPRRLREKGLWAGDDTGGFLATSPRPAPTPLWREVVAHFKALDRRPPSHIPFFNGNLFKEHFSESLNVGDEWLTSFLDQVSDDETPYLFNVIPVEILGTIYERFLGKVVRPQGRGTTVEEKPEVRKAGGVYYTPRYIVDYIVEQTVGKLLDERTPEKSLDLKILDPACGSGSFLIRAFERVCEHWQQDFTKHPSKRKRPLCWVDETTGDVHLTTDLKRRILTNNIYGVDLDAAAVEVTQLSLYLKMLEGETRHTLAAERDLFGSDMPLLPPLQGNIKCGNSLIASDFSIDPDELVRVRAFDWDVQFRDIMKKGGFDAVVGNPPYIRIQTLQESDPAAVEYLHRHYQSAAKGNYDIYVVFVERALGLLNPQGLKGFILPHKFFTSQYGENLRKHLSNGNNVLEIVHFGDQQIFDAAITYTCLMFLSKATRDQFVYIGVKNLNDWTTGGDQLRAILPSVKLKKRDWTFSADPGAEILDRIQAGSNRLYDVAKRIFQGLVTGADPVFILENRGKGLYYSEAAGCEVQLEDELLHPLCKGSVNVRRYAIDEVTKSILFPYFLEGGKAVLIPITTLADKYPKCWRYLLENRKILESRERGKWKHEKWYAFGRSQNLAEMEQAKILTPSIAKHSSFTFDLDDHYYFVGSGGGGGGGYGITLKPDVSESVLYVLALLNSRLLDKIVKSISSPFANGYYAYNRQYIEQLPVRRIDFTNPSDRARHDKLVELVDKMLTLVPKLRAEENEAKKKTLQNAVDATDRQIDQLVYELYGLTEEEIALVEGSGR